MCPSPVIYSLPSIQGKSNHLDNVFPDCANPQPFLLSLASICPSHFSSYSYTVLFFLFNSVLYNNCSKKYILYFKFCLLSGLNPLKILHVRGFNSPYLNRIFLLVPIYNCMSFITQSHFQLFTFNWLRYGGHRTT